MKIEFLEMTKPEIEIDLYRWQPVIAKVDKKYSNEIDDQLYNQTKAYEGDTDIQYKFAFNFNNYLLEGCWLVDIDYTKPDHIELTISYDNATSLI